MLSKLSVVNTSLLEVLCEAMCQQDVAKTAVLIMILLQMYNVNV